MVGPITDAIKCPPTNCPASVFTMAAIRITAIFFTILVVHNNYVLGRPEGQLSTAEAEDVTETEASAVTEESSVTEVENLSRRRRLAVEEDSEEDLEEESSEEGSAEDYFDESGEEGVYHRVFDMAFDDVPTSADGLMEEYYLVL